LAGLALLRPEGPARRKWTLVAIIGLASVAALTRLHATGGYCTPRHALIVTALIVPAAMAGLSALAGVGPAGLARRAVVPGIMGLLIALQASALVAPVNPGMGGYREAGRWLSGRVGEGEKVIDVTGWSQFYGGHDGYTFRNLVEAPGDPSARWLVAREAHLSGPWWYCTDLRRLVDGRTPIREFRSTLDARGRSTRVLVFDLGPRMTAAGAAVTR
ncbi:MAG: hypothetical protein K2X91_03305, partial [Thermoleophilia bacterium]|nr:hypothetical protein [Thermoleophilia bacterium]